jgi:LGFP repeat
MANSDLRQSLKKKVLKTYEPKTNPLTSGQIQGAPDGPVVSSPTSTASRQLLIAGILSKQLVVTDGVEIAAGADASFVKKMSPFLKDVVVLTPSPQAHHLPDRAYLKPSHIDSVAALLKEIAEATKAINDKYAMTRNVLGAPMGAVDFGARDGYFRNFERGAIFVSVGGKAHEVHGAIYQKYMSLGGLGSFLGFPQTDEQSTLFETGRFNHFDRGSIYWTPETSAWSVRGAIRDKWWQLDGDRSHLGYPISDEENWPTANSSDGRISHFQNGSIVFRWADSLAFAQNNAVFLSTTLSAASVKCSAELSFTSNGDWCYKGHMHDDGAFGFNVTVASVLNFQDATGHVIAFKVERHVDGTTSFNNERSDDWLQSGNDDFIRENWQSLQFAGMTSHMDVDTTFGDVVQAVLTILPFVVVAIIVYGFASDENHTCVYGIKRRDEFGRDNDSITIESVPNGTPCRNS